MGLEAQLRSFVQAAKAECPADRLIARSNAEAAARDLVEANLGHLEADALKKLFGLLNTDLRDGEVKPDRFALAFMGKWLSEAILHLDETNVWIERLWRSPTGGELGVLAAMWDENAIPGNARSLPTAILYLKDPTRFAIITNRLSKGYVALTGNKRPTRSKVETFAAYFSETQRLCREHDLPIQALDVLLKLAGDEDEIEDEPAEIEVQAKIALPSFAELEDAYQRDAGRVRMVEHNVEIWRYVHGGLALAEANHISFDPIADFWAMTERRLLVSYFDRRFHNAYVPAEVLRGLALDVFQHFERARTQGRFGRPEIASSSPDRWRELCAIAAEVTRELAPHEREWAELRAVWRQRMKAPSLVEDLSDFLETAAEESPRDAGLVRRMQWLPYLGASAAELARRQRFFAGFYALFNVNSYKTGGAQTLGPILQNNATDTLLDHVRRWAKGTTPLETRPVVKNRADKSVDIAMYSTVIELFGFLNLERVPFYNNLASEVAEAPSPRALYDKMFARGAEARAMLDAAPRDVSVLAKRFRIQVDELPTLPMPMEGFANDAVELRYPTEWEKSIDRTIEDEVARSCLDKAEQFTDLDAAATMYHLMLDAHRNSVTTGFSEVVELATRAAEPQLAPLEPTPTIALPAALRPVADEALACLRGGFHVLFAGPPGTGKTTLAQLIGYAWNRNLPATPSEIPFSDAPATTVGNAAWAPFHTIGGIIPSKDGGFVSHRGIFIAPGDAAERRWALRDECLVLDEMNRADLDRCIGELYPLLSGSVASVRPAGIPDVDEIRTAKRFRLIATINDATIDDIVFPISEGLARRFLRLELPGARLEDLERFLDVGTERARTAASVARSFFDRCETAQLLDAQQTLSLGVGYFKALRAWALGDLELPKTLDADLEEQAVRVLRTALRSAGRVSKKLRDVLEALDG